VTAPTAGPRLSAAIALDVPLGYRVGPWTVGRLIAAGQFGTVYAAYREHSDRTLSTPGRTSPTEGPDRVALKFTRSLTEQGRRGLQLCVDRDHALRERGESCWAIRVYDLIEIQDDHLPRLNGVTAVVMELAECNLNDLMGIPGINVERLLRDTCRAIAGMHEFVEGEGSIFHGDLKPSNILVLEDGTVRIGDLDLIQATEDTHLDASTGHPGTRDYLPPESFAGDPLIRATHDIWAFGIIAHQMLSGGTHPFSNEAGSRAKALQDYAQGKVPLTLDNNLQRFPDIWATVIRECLDPDRERRRLLTPAGIVERIGRESPGSKQPPAQMPRRPTTPPTSAAERDRRATEPVKPRPVPRRVSRLLVVLGCVFSLILGGTSGAFAYHYSRPDVPRMAVDKAAYGRVQSNSGFGGRDLCSKFRTLGAFQYKSCVHHSEGSYYGGMVIRSSSDAAQRVEAVWGDYISSNAGERPTLDSQWKQALILGPGDTVTVLTTPKVVRETRCVASSGYLQTDPGRPTRSPFSTFTATPCTHPPGWERATSDEPAPKAIGAVIPGGYTAADCSGSWVSGAPGTGLQFRACLYHRTDNPNLWNGGVFVRNVSSKTSPPAVIHLRLLSVTAGRSEHTTIADQELAIQPLGPTNPYSIAAPYQRWPSGEDQICLALQAWDAGDSQGERIPVTAPFRSKDGSACAL
jgi:serine/threonine protein kinase